MFTEIFSQTDRPIKSHLLTPFSITSNTKLEASCKKVLFEMLDRRLRPDIPLISEMDERRDEPEIPSRVKVPVGDFNMELLSWGTVSLVGLSRPFDAPEWLYPLVAPFVSSFRVFDLDKRFFNVPKIVVFFRSRPRSATLPVIGSADDSLFCWIMLIFAFKLLLFIGFNGVDVTGALADNVGDTLMLLSYGYCLLPFATLMLWRCWLE